MKQRKFREDNNLYQSTNFGLGGSQGPLDEKDDQDSSEGPKKLLTQKSKANLPSTIFEKARKSEFEDVQDLDSSFDFKEETKDHQKLFSKRAKFSYL